MVFMLASCLPLLSAIKVTSPPAGSVAFLSDDGGLEVTYSLAQPASIKVDVFGFADPNGWPGVKMGPMWHTPQGVLEGSVTLYDLSLGAVRIRFRALSADGRDAVGEEAVEYFVHPYEFFVDMYVANRWLHAAVEREVDACCGETADASSCIAADASAVFCENALEALARGPVKGEQGSQVAPSLPFWPPDEQDSLHVGDVAGDPVSHPPPAGEISWAEGGVDEGEGVCGDEDTAVFALMHGYDLERLVPFVESLRSTGYRGDIHLAHR